MSQIDYTQSFAETPTIVCKYTSDAKKRRRLLRANISLAAAAMAVATTLWHTWNNRSAPRTFCNIHREEKVERARESPPKEVDLVGIVERRICARDTSSLSFRRRRPPQRKHICGYRASIGIYVPAGDIALYRLGEKWVVGAAELFNWISLRVGSRSMSGSSSSIKYSADRRVAAAAIPEHIRTSESDGVCMCAARVGIILIGG